MRVLREIHRRTATMQRPWRLILIVAAVSVAAFSATGAAWVAVQQKVDAVEPLSAYVPQGALMAVESPDFAALLSSWTHSEEEKAWIASDDYAEFSHSRLFSRLGEAQSEFAASAGLAPNANFLRQVAGGESLFAWYDIGKLEFLYVTRMNPGEAANNPLMKLAGKFQMRRAGADSFYIRAEAMQASTFDGDAPGSARTVAFAVHGDLLLLATREDLIANALLLAQHQGDATLRNEPWYTAAVSAVRGDKDAASPEVRPDLRMTLNLARIVPSPYFRSYWVQRNVTQMKQYSAAVSDLYRTNGAFREERVLIPKTPDVGTAAGDLSPILRYVPADSGVYRATAQPGTAQIVAELDRRLISRAPEPYRDLRIAPVADLSDANAGSTGDLDTRIDEQPVPELPLAAALSGLRALIDSEHPDAMLVYSTASEAAAADGVFLPMHSAIVLSASAPWDAAAVQPAFVAALRPRLTVGGAGLSWQARQQDSETWMELGGLQPMAMAVRGGVLIVASDSKTLLQMLKSEKSGQPGSEYRNASTVAGFSHSGERVAFRGLSALIDRNHSAAAERGGAFVTDSPTFFSGNMGSLSDSFKALDSETFVEAPTVNHTVRQTVVYRWVP